MVLLCLLSPLAWGNPCDDVLARAEQATDLEEAQLILGGCLAARGPAHIQLQAAHALLVLADGDGLACRYTEIIQQMLESELHELDQDTIARITSDAERQACRCDPACNQDVQQPRHNETATFDGLQWALHTNGSDIRWPDAIDYCAELVLAGHSDWRLPTMDELESLHDPDSADGKGIRSPISIDTCCLWSGESLVDRPAEDGDKTAGPPDRYHWGFMFDGGLEYYAVHIFEDGQALCVRDVD